MKYIITFLIVFMSCELFSQEIPYLTSRDHAIMINTHVNYDDNSITLDWQENPLVESGYAVARRENATGDFVSLTGSYLPASTTSYTDTDIEQGILYEYYIYGASKGSINTKIDGKDTVVAVDFFATGYMSAGINVNIDYQKGRVLLIVESELFAELPDKINRLRDDLKDEGWGVTMQTFGRTEGFNTDSVKAVKKFIIDEYEKDNNVTTVFLLGRIAVPYSGQIAPDAHGNHVGAWPADLFYGQLDDGSWRDFQINNTTASRTQNHNVPGDGKYDIGQLPFGMDVSIAVGRVDFYNMNEFIDENTSETDLYENYLDKNHNFRTGEYIPKWQGVVDDNFAARRYTEGFASGGWRNIAANIGYENVKKGDLIGSLKTESHLWAYGCGGGTYKSAGGIGSTADFKGEDINGVFTMIFGSYFGDWDSEDNFLRAPLASNPSVLTNVWSGRPQWYMHHMAMGFSIGYSTLLSQNNYTEYVPNIYEGDQIATSGNRQVHNALMGDPTLVMYPSNEILPPENVTIVKYSEPTYRVEWEEPPTDDIKFYNVYRATEEYGAYTRLNDKPISGSQYIDENVEDEGELYYMVKTTKPKAGNGGIFYLESVGVTSSILTGVEEISAGGINISASPLPANEYVNISISLPANSNVKMIIYDMNGREIHSFPKKALHSGKYDYRWNIDNNISAGIYLLRTHIDGQAFTNKLIINPNK